MPRILLVRHGQSVWNAAGRWQGQADIELSELGREQARAAMNKLGSFDVIASSTLIRAMETAVIIAEGLGVGPIVPVPDLVERHAGEWSGLTRSDIETAWPGYLADERRPPGYESDEDMFPRVLAGLRKVAGLVEDPDGQALVVAHGGLIYMLEARAGRIAGRIANLGGLWLSIDETDTITVGERVLLIDEARLRSAQSSDIL